MSSEQQQQQQQHREFVENDSALDTTRLVTCTRFYSQNVDDHRRLKEFIERSVKYSAFVLIAVRVEVDTIDTVAFVESLNDERVLAVPVTPWGVFTSALNALMIRTAQMGFGRILFQSVEVKVSDAYVGKMMKTMGDDNEALVVGLRLPGHTWRCGPQHGPSGYELGGLTSPWNTCALWDVSSLALTGFMTVSDGIVSGVAAAIEEATVIGFHQHQHRTKLTGFRRHRAILLDVGSVTWAVDVDNPRQKLKMQTKKQRSVKQIKALGLRAQDLVVHHVEMK